MLDTKQQDTTFNIGTMDYKSGNLEQALKNWKIAASAGDYTAMHNMTIKFEDDAVSRESIESTLMEYNSICAKMRSEARDAFIRVQINAG